MKKYHLFAGLNYYPGGGMCDYEGSFNTFEEAEAEGERKKREGYDWYNIATTDWDGNLTWRLE
jgi:hypothetical protein